MKTRMEKYGDRRRQGYIEEDRTEKDKNKGKQVQRNTYKDSEDKDTKKTRIEEKKDS